MPNRIQARAIRRCGELLKQVEADKGGYHGNYAHDGTDTRISAWKGGELLAKMEKDKGGYAGNYAAVNVTGASPYNRTLEAAKLHLGASLRMGDWLRNGMDKDKGGRPITGCTVQPVSEPANTYSSLGIEKTDAFRLQRFWDWEKETQGATTANDAKAQAIEKKVEEQVELVRWWDEVVTPGKGSSNQYSAKTQIGVLAKSDAESLTGISQQQVSRWNKSLQNLQQYRARLMVIWPQPNSFNRRFQNSRRFGMTSEDENSLIQQLSDQLWSEISKGSLSDQELERRKRAQQRLKEAYSSIPWYKAQGEKYGDQFWASLHDKAVLSDG